MSQGTRSEDGDIPVTMSTEDVVNKIGAKPSPKFLLLVVGLMSFQIMKAMVAYFPNFGGYLPYKEWRCVAGSQDCYGRVNDFVFQGNNTWPKEDMIELENRCTITLGELDAGESTLFLHGGSGRDIGSIKIQQQLNNLVITVSSSTSYDPVTLKAVRTDTGPLTCTLQFTGSKTLEDSSTLICGDVIFELDSENEVVHFLKDAVQTVKFLSAEGVDYYLLECPDKDQYNKNNLCGNSSIKGLIRDTDFSWYTNGRSTFAIDWNLYCGGEVLRSILGSVFFGGAILGTFIGGNLFDLFGRKTGALVGYGMVTIATLAASFAPSIWFMFVCRFLQGAGVYIGATGVFVLLLEYTALRFRIQANIGVQLTFGIGYLINTFFAYFIKDWHWLVAVDGILFVLSIIPLLLLPDSPRFYLVNKRDEERARKSLKWLAKINGSDFDVDTIRLSDLESANDQKDVEEPGFLETMRDFLKYKELLVQLLIQMWLWLVAGFLYYGFSFSWNELGENIYISYMFAALGEILAYLGMGFPIKYLGRRVSIMGFYLAASITFLVALLPFKLSSSFSLEQLSCLLGSMFVSAAFCAIYLYSAELAPTSHRGKVLGYSSFAARIGSFCGPQAALLFSWSKAGTLVLFTVISASAGILCYRLPDTKDVPTPSTAAEVQRRKDEKVNGRREAGATYENKCAT